MEHFKFYFLMFLVHFLSLFPARAASADICREQIPSKVCSINHQPHLIQLHKDPVAYFADMDSRPCTEKSREHALILQKMYDRLPELSQKALCHVQRIHVAPLEGAGGMTHFAYAQKNAAAPSRHPKISGFYLVLDTERVETSETCSSGESRFLKRFTSKDPGTTGQMRLEIQKDSADCLLWHTLVHETAHMLDFANGLTTWPNGFYSSESAFNSLSWDLSFYTPTPLNAPELTSRSWEFGENPSPENLEAFARQFQQTNFASVYAMSNPLEDFAETFTYLYIESAVLYDFNGRAYDFKDRGALEAKKNRVRELLKNPELNFDPGISPAYDISVFL